MQFWLDKNGARLRLVSYVSRLWTNTEKKFHSSLGESTAGRWGISQNQHYLWGAHFYWMCDCKAVKEVVEHTGSIAMEQIWDRELIGYHFTVIHQSENIMGDVDALTWRFGEIVSVYLCVANILQDKENLKHPDYYDDAAFFTKVPTRLKICKDNITVRCIQNMSQPSNIAHTSPPLESLSSNLVTPPLMLHTTTPQPLREYNDETTSFKQL